MIDDIDSWSSAPHDTTDYIKHVMAVDTLKHVIGILQSAIYMGILLNNAIEFGLFWYHDYFGYHKDRYFSGDYAKFILKSAVTSTVSSWYSTKYPWGYGSGRWFEVA